MKTIYSLNQIEDAIESVLNNEVHQKCDYNTYSTLSDHFHELLVEIDQQKAVVERLTKALEKIAHPIAFMQEEATKEKRKLDGGIAVMLSRDPSYLKSIAEDALRGDE